VGQIHHPAQSVYDIQTDGHDQKDTTQNQAVQNDVHSRTQRSAHVAFFYLFGMLAVTINRFANEPSTDSQPAYHCTVLADKFALILTIGGGGALSVSKEPHRISADDRQG
jgi:hypothetical protein